MSDYIIAATAALLGLLVPTCAGWLWNRVKHEMQSGVGSLMRLIKEIQIEQVDMRNDHGALKAVQITQGEAIAYLQGADSQRSQTATAALEAARLLLYPKTEDTPKSVN